MALNLTLNQTINTTINTDITTLTTTIKPLIFFIIGIAIYSFFIYKFYRFLAERDILKLHWHKKYGHEGFFQILGKVIAYLIENIILIPIIVFFWFIVLALLITLLSSNTPSEIMLIAMAIIGAIRITAYYKEDLSKDLAKMIPFALLGVFIVNMELLPLDAIMHKFFGFMGDFQALLIYLAFVAALELILRIIRLFTKAFQGKIDVPTDEDDST